MVEKMIKMFVQPADISYICSTFPAIRAYNQGFQLHEGRKKAIGRKGKGHRPNLSFEYQTILIPKVMNKTDLVNAVAAKGLSKADAKTAVDAALESIANALTAGDNVALIGFGTFSINERPAREGINPATKEKIQIAAKKVIKFKAGAGLAEAVNK